MRYVIIPPAGAGGSCFISSGCGCFCGSTFGRNPCIIDQKPGGISKDFTYGSVDCHYGTGTVSVPGNLQSGGDVFEYLCILVCFCNFNYCGTAAWSDLCKNSDRPDIPVLYIEIRLFPYGSTNPGKILTPLYFRKDLQKQTN